MVHGSGSHHRGRSDGGREAQQTRGGGGGSQQRRGNESQQQRSSSSRNNTTERHNHGGGSRSHHHHDRSSRSNNGSSGRSANNNNSNTRNTTSAPRVPVSSVTTTTTRTATTRNNHGTGTHHHSRSRSAGNTRNTTTTTAAAATANTPTAATTRPNHGSGTHHQTSSSWWNNRRNHQDDDNQPHRTRSGRVESSSPRRVVITPTGNHRPRQTTTTTTRTNRRHRYSRAFNNEQERDSYEYQQQLDNNGCGELLCRFCGWFWSCVGTILLGLGAVTAAILCCKPCLSTPSSSEQRLDESTTATTLRAVGTTTNTTNHQHIHPRRRRRRPKCSWWLFPIVGLLLSVITLFALIQNSTMDSTITTDNISPSDDTTENNVWTLFVGETQRIFLPRLVRDVRVTVESASDPSVQAAVFKFTRNCPPLSGPPVILQHDAAFDLPGGNFEYDYYNLYPGSTVDVRFNQLNGATYFYLLKGAEALRDIQTGRNIDPNHWEAIAETKRYVTPNTSPSSSDVHYKVRGPINDIFTLVYDNASTQRESSVDVETDLSLTTYNLAGYTPLCDNMHWWGKDGDSCHITATRDNCVVLEAFATGPGDDDNNNNNSNSNNDRVISLRIDAYRNWTRIWLWSTLPMALASFICIWQFLLVHCCSCCHGRRRHTTAVTEDEEEADRLTEPLLSNNEQQRPPPPTAPHHHSRRPPQPSAPPSNEDDPPVIVVPPESVEALPMGTK